MVGLGFGSFIGGQQAAASQEQAWRNTKVMMKNRHQWEVEDLIAAGLNPILSAHTAPSMGPSPAPVDRVSPMEVVGKGVEQMVGSAKAGATMKAGIRTAKATAGITESESERMKSVARAAPYVKDTAVAQSREAFSAAEIAFQNSREAKYDAQIKKTQVHRAQLDERYDRAVIPGKLTYPFKEAPIGEWGRFINRVIRQLTGREQVRP